MKIEGKSFSIHLSEGHKYLYLPNHPNSKPNNYYAEHRYIMEQSLGRFLDSTEIVHHKNHNGLDNRLENLVILTKKEHAKEHYSSERMVEGRRKKYKDGWNPAIRGKNNPKWNGGKIKRKCNNCEKSWMVFPSLYNHKKYCSKICRTSR